LTTQLKKEGAQVRPLKLENVDISAQHKDGCCCGGLYYSTPGPKSQVRGIVVAGGVCNRCQEVLLPLWERNKQRDTAAMNTLLLVLRPPTVSGHR
jgi:hypothetical protein